MENDTSQSEQWGIMEEYEQCQQCGSAINLGFGYNDTKFSDRTFFVFLVPDSNPIYSASTLENYDGHDLYTTACSSTNTKTIHVNSLILAAKSPFFYKLFSNGMAESSQKHVTLQVQESEEESFLDMLKFMYTNTLSSTTPSALLDVLIAADKYEVASCMNYCVQLLPKLSTTRELALRYLDLPTGLMADAAQSLRDGAKEFFVTRFKDMSKFEEEMLNLPLVGIKAVLSSDDLQVDSEDIIYDFVLKWARTHYKELDERQEILTTCLLHLIRFPFMSIRKLETVVTCKDISFQVSAKLLFDALSLQSPYRELSSVPVGRAYRIRPVKITRLHSPHKVCKVYLDLKREECAHLLPYERIYFQHFDLVGQEFYLMVEHCISEQTSVHTLGFFLGKKKEGSSIGVEFEVLWRKKPDEKFVGDILLDYNFAEARAFGSRDLFEVPWDTLMAENSRFFIKGVLHLKAVIKVIKNQQHMGY